MGIDLSNAEARKAFIEEKFADILSNIKDLYGSQLMNKLFDRLDRTIDQFDQDIHSVFEKLDERETDYLEQLPAISDLKNDYLRNLEQRKQEEEAEKTVEQEAAPAPESIELDADDSDIIHRLMKRRH